MAWSFGDSFDLYAAVADMGNGYWDAAPGAGGFIAGRFSGSQAYGPNIAGVGLNKTSSVNDAVHHLVVSYKHTAAISGTTLGTYFELFDGATGQCSVVFRSDGAILLTSGGPTGTVLATYAGAFPVTATWYAFEIEVVINNTTGSFTVRKNGNNVNDFTLGSLNTRVSANNYANKLQIWQQNASPASNIDDLFWRSDASSVAWLGDIRCYARMPASDASVTFSRTSTGVLTQTVPTSASASGSTGTTARYTAITAGYSGTITNVGVAFNLLGTTATMKCAIFADNGSGAPGALLAAATASVNPVVVGTNLFTFSPAVPIVKGVQYWVGAVADGTGTFLVGTSSAVGASGASSLAAFPQANPVVTTPAVPPQVSWTYTATPANWQAVTEVQQDGLASYVYDSNPGDADFYSVASIASTPASVIATTVRAYAQKSDAGTRTMAVQLKSGATTVASPTLVLTTSGWQWAWRTDIVDPATGVAWTPAAVNNATIGPKVVA